MVKQTFPSLMCLVANDVPLRDFLLDFGVTGVSFHVTMLVDGTGRTDRPGTIIV